MVTLVGFGTFYVGKRAARAEPQSAYRRRNQDKSGAVFQVSALVKH